MNVDENFVNYLENVTCHSGVKQGLNDLPFNIVVISRVENSYLMFIFEIDQIFINYS